MLGGGHHKTSVLFVCLGNICRSPMAEGAFLVAADRAGLDVIVDSAGTASYHLGDPPDYRAIATARDYGIDISRQSARQVEISDYHRFDCIIAMDTANLLVIKARAPRDSTAKISLLLGAVPDREGQSVPDPYHGKIDDFHNTWALINEGVAALIARLRAEAANAAR